MENSDNSTQHNVSLSELLAKFENGVHLYQTNGIFKHCIESLLHDGDVYNILEDVILMLSDQQKRYNELISSGTLRNEIVLTKEQFDKIEESLNPTK